MFKCVKRIETIEALERRKKNKLNKNKLKITLDHWEYTCGDGCCTDYGVKLYLNDEELKHPDPEQFNNNHIGEDVKTALESVLKKLGYEVEFKETYDY